MAERTRVRVSVRTVAPAFDEVHDSQSCPAVLVDSDLVAIRAAALPRSGRVEVVVTPTAAGAKDFEPEVHRPRRIDIVRVDGQPDEAGVAFIRLQEHASYRPEMRPQGRVRDPGAVSLAELIGVPGALQSDQTEQPVVRTELSADSEMPEGPPLRTLLIDPGSVAGWACWLVPWCDPDQPPITP